MRYFTLFFLCAFAVSGRAQITLEHTYSKTGQFGLIEVDSGEWRYVDFNGRDSISLYYLNHTFDRVIRTPTYDDTNINYSVLIIIAKRLFDHDSGYEYMLSTGGGRQTLRVLNEADSELLSCYSCQLGSSWSTVSADFNEPQARYGFTLTTEGTKMLLSAGSRRQIYSLPGKLPGCATAARSDVNSSQIMSEPILPSSAYPNPSSNAVRIAYELPAGVSHGEIILTSEDGREVKRYRVTNAFSDILIENAELASGSYFYTVMTERGASAAKRIVVMK